jgi:hypothetical protein
VLRDILDAHEPARRGRWPITGASFILVHQKADKPAVVLTALKFFDWAYQQAPRSPKIWTTCPSPAGRQAGQSVVERNQGRQRKVDLVEVAAPTSSSCSHDPGPEASPLPCGSAGVLFGLSYACSLIRTWPRHPPRPESHPGVIASRCAWVGFYTDSPAQQLSGSALRTHFH